MSKSNFIIKLDKGTQKVLKENASILYDSCGYKHYFLPFWFSETDDPNHFEMNYLDKLPPDLKEAINKMRGVEDEK